MHRIRFWLAAAGGILLVPSIAVSAHADTVTVRTAAELTSALAAAAPGQTIELAAGTYDGSFTATAKGTASQPITLTGPREAVLSNHGGYGLHLDGAAYWKLTGFAVSGASKGIVLDHTNHTVLDRLAVSNVDAEAIHLRASSSDNTISDSSVRDTGRKQPQFGEGIYLGSAKSHWDDYGENGGPDRSDRNQVIGNQLGPNIRAEAIDIKEGTQDGVIRGNSFDGHGISGQNYADSWVDVKGGGYRLADNTGTYDGDGALVDGFQVHQQVSGMGCANTFDGNKSDLGGASGYAIDVTDQSKCDRPNVVRSTNTVRDAGSGLTNIDVTGR
ncbi:right-handed parallel beta-helix repeat-containing protein [Fodinicola acaciae]|uniref:right-handed parallel beta-helix repeat-containing protein n=1 Tax=Fodinicola acaciae TaxID=2681555 RepID=UPI0013D5B737|nr:right-handed parallel beta-helix repeat-containing protein [Fodinicola acaciae]